MEDLQYKKTIHKYIKYYEQHIEKGEVCNECGLPKDTNNSCWSCEMFK